MKQPRSKVILAGIALLVVALATGTLLVRSRARDTKHVAEQGLPEIVVSNIVRIVNAGSEGETQDIVWFSMVVVNERHRSIPDLRPRNVSRYARFLVNGCPQGTPADMGGIYKVRPTDTLRNGETDLYGWGTTVASWAAESAVSTIQWEYLGVRSPMLQVNWRHKTIRQVGEVKQARICRTSGCSVWRGARRR